MTAVVLAYGHESWLATAVRAVLLRLGVLGISAIAWLATLARLPLSVAYPFDALGI